MAKIYTAQEMRARANLKRNVWGDLTTAAMLRQAADALEREEKREKEYEYKVLYRRRDGCVCDSIGHAQNIQLARKTLGIYKGYKDAHIVRRLVGEWEEVKE